MTATFERGEGELAEYDDKQPWMNLEGYLEDDSVVESTMTSAEGCAVEDPEGVSEAYQSGEKVEVCVVAGGDGSSPFAGVFYGHTSDIGAGTVWEK